MKILLKYYLNYAAGVYAEKEWMINTGSAEVTFMDNADDAVEVDKSAEEVSIENAEAMDAYKEDARNVEEQGMIAMIRSLLPEVNVMGTFVNNVAEAYTMNVSSSNYKTAVRLPVIGNTAVTYEVIEKEQYKAVLTAWGEDSNVCRGREEVLAELEDQLKVFPPTQRDENYEVAEWRKYEPYKVTVRERIYEVAKQEVIKKEWTEHGEKIGAVKEMMKMEMTWQKQTSRFYQPSL
jgi:hypothetical protein